MAKTKIAGYRQLSEAETQFVNNIKAHGEQLRVLISELMDTEATTRWLADGEHYLQLGLMCLVRAVTRPESF